MFKIEAGKKYVRRNGEVVTLKQCQKLPECLTDGKWVFNPNDSREDGYRVFGDRNKYPHDIVAPYVEKKPRKASSPYKKLLNANTGDVFILKGERFVVKEFELFDNNRIFLTHMDKKNPGYYQSLHVRNKFNKAVFNRTELIDLLRSGKYTVG